MTEKCGCRIKLTDDKWTKGMAEFHADIVYCPTHAQAFILLQALKDVLSYDSEAPVTILAQANEALARAEGK